MDTYLDNMCHDAESKEGAARVVRVILLTTVHQTLSIRLPAARSSSELSHLFPCPGILHAKRP